MRTPGTCKIEGGHNIATANSLNLGDFSVESMPSFDNCWVPPSASEIGTMAFGRKDYGMNSNIPFIKIANRVQVDINLRWKRISGPPPAFAE